MKAALGNDHAALEARAVAVDELAKLGVEMLDLGVCTPDAVDYPDVAEAVCRAVLDGRADTGILLCGTGVGISIAANKIHGIRCALCVDEYSAEMAHEHNDANVIALRGRDFDPELNRPILRAWFSSTFSGAERHQRRLDKITKLETNG